MLRGGREVRLGGGHPPPDPPPWIWSHHTSSSGPCFGNFLPMCFLFPAGCGTLLVGRCCCLRLSRSCRSAVLLDLLFARFGGLLPCVPRGPCELPGTKILSSNSINGWKIHLCRIEPQSLERLFLVSHVDLIVFPRFRCYEQGMNINESGIVRETWINRNK